MALFLSTYTNKVDKKGRVSVPAQFRCALNNTNFVGIILFRSYTNEALECCSMNHMEKLNQNLSQTDTFSSEQEDLATVIFADAQALNFDQDGRILIPQKFLNHCQIDDYATFVGCGNTFQIWQPQKFKDYQNSARERTKNKRITLRSLPTTSPTQENK